MNIQPRNCPREYEVDEFWLAQRPPEHPMTMHLRKCEICRSALESYLDVEREFEEEVFPATIEDVVRQAPRLRDTENRGQLIRLAAVVVPFAAAAMIALFVLFPASPSDENHFDASQSYVGEKGDLGFELYCQRGGKVFQLREGDTIFEHDALRFSPVFSDKKERYGMVVSVDERGGLQAYFPLNGIESARIQGTGPLPGSIIMDDSYGTERLFFLVSDERFRLLEVTEAVKKAFVESGGAMVPYRLPIDLDQVSIGLRKEKR